MTVEPISPAGYLRGLHVLFDGVTTTGGPFEYERKRYRRAKNLQRRCGEVWERRCQRKRNHAGLHWWRHRKREVRWGLPEPDAPFSVVHSLTRREALVVNR